MHDKGFKEVTLLGQNVNSYGLLPNGKRPENGVSFAELLHKVAQSVPDMRVRFTTSNPEDMTEDIIEAVATNQTSVIISTSLHRAVVIAC